MLWFRYSIIIVLLFSGSLWAREKFTSQECLEAKYKTTVVHRGKYFGLLESKLNIDKSECIIEIKHKSILEDTWLIDICREPIHLKVTSKGSQEVYKRLAKCERSDQLEFCQSARELLGILQDHGLIFAKGERESLGTAHGQVHCVVLLLKKYLNEGILFSKYSHTAIDLFSDEPKEACEIPQKKESSKEIKESIKEDTSIKPETERMIESSGESEASSPRF